MQPLRPRNLPRLSATLTPARERFPETVLQIGEGNFLRAFIDWMLERMHRAGVFAGGAVLVQPIPRGNARAINEQDGLYTVLLRGVQDDVPVDRCELITRVSRCLDPHLDFAGFMTCARNPETRFVVSNTTEAGITLDDDDRLTARPAQSFPGKLTQLLHERFLHFRGDPARGWVMLPCELIPDNGEALRCAVIETARRWGLCGDFLTWLQRSCAFANTLVDRIVAGYPAENADSIQQSLGYEDRLLVAAEPFHSWAIAGPPGLAHELPLDRAGLDVIWTDDIAPYRERKVRILNGAHSLAAAVGSGAGLETVADCVADAQIRSFLEAAIEHEVLPTLPLPPDALRPFAGSVFERFRNPFLQHRLADIALNATSKFRTRVLGTIADSLAASGRLPPRLTFALAALFAHFRGDVLRDGALIGTWNSREYFVRDDPAVLRGYSEAWAAHASGTLSEAEARRVVRPLLSHVSWWGRDLRQSWPDIESVVAGHLAAICTHGMRAALRRV